MPPGPTGAAAPMFVAGAMGARYAAATMNVPAELAWAPAGDTNATTGISAASIFTTMSRVESRSPPGVSTTMTTNRPSSSTAASMTRERYQADTGSMTESSDRTATCGPSPPGDQAGRPQGDEGKGQHTYHRATPPP